MAPHNTHNETHGGTWTFLSNHGHVLVCLAHDADVRVRDIAAEVGITERAVQRILTELEEAGAIRRDRNGRRNHYRVRRACKLRHPLESDQKIGLLLDALTE